MKNLIGQYETDYGIANVSDENLRLWMSDRFEKACGDRRRKSTREASREFNKVTDAIRELHAAVYEVTGEYAHITIGNLTEIFEEIQN